MGEPWQVQSPFLFFTDYAPPLDEAVREGVAVSSPVSAPLPTPPRARVFRTRTMRRPCRRRTRRRLAMIPGRSTGCAARVSSSACAGAICGRACCRRGRWARACWAKARCRRAGSCPRANGGSRSTWALCRWRMRCRPATASWVRTRPGCCRQAAACWPAGSPHEHGCSGARNGPPCGPAGPLDRRGRCRARGRAGRAARRAGGLHCETVPEYAGLRTACCGQLLAMPEAAGAACWVDEQGTALPARADAQGRWRVPDQPGYWQWRRGDRQQAVAVAPQRAWWPRGTLRGWGLSAQVYSLRALAMPASVTVPAVHGGASCCTGMAATHWR